MVPVEDTGKGFSAMRTLRSRTGHGVGAEERREPEDSPCRVRARQRFVKQGDA